MFDYMELVTNEVQQVARTYGYEDISIYNTHTPKFWYMIFTKKGDNFHLCMNNKSQSDFLKIIEIGVEKKRLFPVYIYKDPNDDKFKRFNHVNINFDLWNSVDNKFNAGIEIKKSINKSIKIHGTTLSNYIECEAQKIRDDMKVLSDTTEIYECGEKLTSMVEEIRGFYTLKQDFIDYLIEVL